MKKQTTIYLTIILIIGALLGFGVYYGLSLGTEQVVVPEVEIKAGEMFSTENLKVISIPKAINLESIMYKTPDEIIGKYALSSLVANEPITTSKISDRKSDGYLGFMKNAEENYTVLIPVQTDQPIRNVAAGDYVSLFSSIEVTQEEIATGQIGNSYHIVGVESDEDENIIGITIEVEPKDITNVSHMIINTDYLISFVSGDKDERVLEGVTSTQFIEMILGEGNVIHLPEEEALEEPELDLEVED